MSDSLFLKYRKEPTIELRNQIVEKNLYIVDILVRKYLNKGIEYDDLYQVGAIALIHAVERFDPELGYEFSSFATPTILGEIRKYFRDKGWALKVPRRAKENAAKVNAAGEKLEQNLNRSPSVEELANESGLSHEEVIEALETGKAYIPYSIDASSGADEDEANSLEKFLGFQDSGYEDLEIREIVENVISGFSETYKYIFRQRFIENRSQAQIADKLGVSQMTISRAERAMIDSFKKERGK